MRRSSYSFRNPAKLLALNMSDEIFGNPKLFWKFLSIILGELAYESCFDLSLHLLKRKWLFSYIVEFLDMVDKEMLSK
jgi:hypothetical protein